MNRIALAIAVAGLLVSPALAQMGTQYYTGFDSAPNYIYGGFIAGQGIYQAPLYDNATATGGPWTSQSRPVPVVTYDSIVAAPIRGDQAWQSKSAPGVNGQWTGKGLSEGFPDGRTITEKAMQAPADPLVVKGTGGDPVDRPLVYTNYLVKFGDVDANMMQHQAMGTNTGTAPTYSNLYFCSGKALQQLATTHPGWPFSAASQRAPMVAAGWLNTNANDLYMVSLGGYFANEADTNPWGNQGFNNVTFTASAPIQLAWNTTYRVAGALSISNKNGAGLNYSNAGADETASPTRDSSTYKAYSLASNVGDAGTLVATLNCGVNNYDRQADAGDTLRVAGKTIDAWFKRDQSIDNNVAVSAGVVFDSFQMWALARPTGSADFNLDYSVGLGDLGILAGSYGSTNAFRVTGDADLDGDVDLGDLGILAGQYGNAYSAVPEPVTMVLLGLGGLVALRRRG